MSKVVFIGNSGFAVPVLRAIHASANRVACVITRHDRVSGRGHKERPTPVADAGMRLGLEVERTARPGEGRRVAEQHGPDFLVVCDYGDMIPRSLLRIPRCCALNVHPSLLPRWRGAAPIERAMLAGDSVTGVSIMQMDTGLDSGPVLLSSEVEIGLKTAGELHEELAELGAGMAVDAINRYEELAPNFQDEAQATYAEKIRRHEAEIDWTCGAEKIARQIRALHPKPCAHSFLGDLRIKFGWAQALKMRSNAPGKIHKLTAKAAVVGCGRNCVEVGALQKPGGRMLEVREFTNGFALKPGDVFASPGSSVDRANPS